MIGSRVRLGVLSILAFLLVVGLSACSSVAPGPTPPPAGDAVKAALNKLGVDTNASSSRNAPTGGVLPSGYAPLGATVAYGIADSSSNSVVTNPSDEVLLVGPTGPSSNPASLIKIDGATVAGSTANYGTPTVLKSFDATNYPWADAASASPSNIDANVQTLRSVATGDLDGDGLQDLVAVYVVPGTNGGNATLQLQVIQDGDTSTPPTAIDDVTGIPINANGIEDVAVVTGDFDGDGKSDIAVATASATGGQLLFLTNTAGTYQVDARESFTPTIPGSAMYFRLATGNLDYDRADELAIVVDEFSNGSTVTGDAYYYVFDDANHGYAPLKSGQVGIAGYPTKAADISLADIDGDGVDEIIMGGPTEFETNCNSYGQIVVALDDAAHGFAQLGSYNEQNAEFAKCGTYNNNTQPEQNEWKVYFTFIKTADLTGNGVPSIIANQFVYDYNAPGRPGLQPRLDTTNGTPVKLPDTVFMDPAGPYDYAATLSPTRADVAVGDVTGDGRQDVLVYVQWHYNVRVYGQVPQVPTFGDKGWGQLSSIPTNLYKPWDYVKPILVPTETEPSGPVMKYVAGSHRLVYTQPIVVAALAAAPCEKGIHQNLSACVTTFGQSSSSGGGTSASVSVTAGVTVGVEAEVDVPFVGTFTSDWTTSMSTTATHSISNSYTVTKTVTYSTGSMQDGVVFTTVPYDQYTYKVVSAANPTLVGKLFEVSLPRQPITLIAERSFYNAAVAPIPEHTFSDGRPASTAPKIDSTVFQHTIGDVTSYPTASQKDGLLRQYYPNTPDLTTLQKGPQAVGEGPGSTQLSIDVSTQITKSNTLALDYSFDFQTTGEGFVFGFNVGYGASVGLTVTSGTSTTYTGTVGSIDAADFNANQYQYGLFTYVQPVDGEQIEVVNYWTTPQ